MPSDGIEVKLKPSLKKLQRQYEKRTKKLVKLETPFKKISIYLDRWVQINFKTEGGKVGEWDELAEGGRRKKGGGFDFNAKILQDVGRLRASFLPFASKKDAGIGSELPYAKVHDKGIGVPQRRILPEKGEIIDDAKKILDQHVKESIK